MRVSEGGAAEALTSQQQGLEQRRTAHGLVLERDLDELMERGCAAPVPQFEEVERGVSEWGDFGDRHGLLLPSLATVARVTEWRAQLRNRFRSASRQRSSARRSSCRERRSVTNSLSRVALLPAGCAGTASTTPRAKI